MSLPIPVLPSVIWEGLAVMRTILVYAFPVFMLGGHYIERSSIERMILTWGGLYALLTLPAAIALGSWRGVVAAGAPLVLCVVLAAFTVVLRGAATGYIDAARATEREDIR